MHIDTKKRIEKHCFIFTYTTTHLAYKDKVRFYYALKGRDGKTGIIKRANIEQLGKTVLLVPFENQKEVQEFVEYWKCKYQKREAIILN